MTGRFDGKVALVTGGAAGIGKATCIAYAKEGAAVVIADVLEDEGQATAQEIIESGGQAIFLRTDVSKTDNVIAMVKESVATYGRLDCAFNNAGIEGKMAPTAESTEENWDLTISVNLKGVYLCMKYEIEQMLKQGGGVIVNMASVAGMVGFASLPAYCASKGGVIQLTKAAALEYAQNGIRINVVCPGGIRTAMVDRIEAVETRMRDALLAAHPIGRLGRPEEVADVVLWLSSDESSFVTGYPIAVDGGYVAV